MTKTPAEFLEELNNMCNHKALIPIINERGMGYVIAFNEIASLIEQFQAEQKQVNNANE